MPRPYGGIPPELQRYAHRQEGLRHLTQERRLKRNDGCVTPGAADAHAYPLCHCEERSDAAISLQQGPSLANEIATLRSQ